MVLAQKETCIRLSQPTHLKLSKYTCNHLTEVGGKDLSSMGTY